VRATGRSPAAWYPCDQDHPAVVWSPPGGHTRSCGPAAPRQIPVLCRAMRPGSAQVAGSWEGSGWATRWPAASRRSGKRPGWVPLPLAPPRRRSGQRRGLVLSWWQGWRAPAALVMPPGGGQHRRRPASLDATHLPDGPGVTRMPAGLGPATTGTPAGSPRDSQPGWAPDEAVAVFYHAHYRSLARIAALLGDDVAAEEIVQRAFVSMHRLRRHLRDGDEALGYLRRAVVSRARSQGASAGLAARRRAGAPSGQPTGTAQQTPLMAALRSLPARQREAVVLKFYADWPDAQITIAMGISPSALGGHLRQGISALQAASQSDTTTPQLPS
jgi:DNA-directed RNA polymerase specialized sigma24 family protein